MEHLFAVITVCCLVFIVPSFIFYKQGVQDQEKITKNTVDALAEEFGCDTDFPRPDSPEIITVTCKDGRIVVLDGKTGKRFRFPQKDNRGQSTENN